MWCYGDAFNSSRLGKDLPRWANQICLFNKSHIHRHFKGQQSSPGNVTAVSPGELLKHNGINSVQVSQRCQSAIYKRAVLGNFAWPS